jgi:hypothetical protein
MIASVRMVTKFFSGGDDLWDGATRSGEPAFCQVRLAWAG